MELPVRQTARLVLLDESKRILLIMIENKDVHDPQAPLSKPFWITPGGKIEEGETTEETLRRELKEEAGISQAHIGPCIWSGEHILNWKGIPTILHERFYFVRVPTSEVTLDGLSPDELEVYRSHKWWTTTELASSQEIFIPRDLPSLATAVIEGRVPEKTIEIDLSTPT